jgi:hypothetical protein
MVWTQNKKYLYLDDGIRMVTDKILHREHKGVQKSLGHCFGVPTV